MALQLLEGRGRYRTRHSRGESGALAVVRHVDLLLVVPTFLLSAIGVVVVYSATRSYYPAEPTYFAKRQVLYLVLGVVTMLFTTFVDYRRLEQWAYPIYGGAVLLLVAVFGFHSGVSTSASGSSTAARWIPLGPIQLQPSELGVLAVIVAIACYVHHSDGDLRPSRLVPILALAGVPALLIVKQPDLGTGVVVSVVLLALLVVAGTRLRWLALLVALGVLVAFAAIELHLLKGYQMQRLTSFFHPSAANASSSGYELNQAENAIGGGGLMGTGLFKGPVTNLGYVPEQYADFIFSAIGEQLGFLGSAAVLGLYALMSLRILRAMRSARDTLGRMICGGALAFLAFSVFENIGMNIGIMPITGIPLPFISYGGSAILAFYALIGLVANVEIRRYGAT